MFNLNIIKADINNSWQYLFQDPASPYMEGLIHFHDDLMFIIIFIAGFVSFLLYRSVVLFNKSSNSISNNIIHNTQLEIIWTMTPAIILMFIAIPSFSLLFSLDEVIDPSLTLKVIGHQWYWSYEYSDELFLDNNLSGLEFDSYMLPLEDLDKGQLRLLEVDNRVILPIETPIRVIVSSADVLHCFAVPALGMKLDACPGRLNQTSLYIKRSGVFYGQCSEICGINHGFMPIVIESVPKIDFFLWSQSNNLK